MKRWIGLVWILALAWAATPYSYSTYKTELNKATQNKKAQKPLSVQALSNLLPKTCLGTNRQLLESGSKVGNTPTPPWVVFGFGKTNENPVEGGALRLTLVDYGGLSGAARAQNLDIGARLYDSKINPSWKAPTLLYRPSADSFGFGYVNTREAALRLVVAGRFDLRLEHNNTPNMKPIEACLKQINLKQLVASASK